MNYQIYSVEFRKEDREIIVVLHHNKLDYEITLNLTDVNREDFAKRYSILYEWLGNLCEAQTKIKIKTIEHMFRMLWESSLGSQQYYDYENYKKQFNSLYGFRLD